MRVRDHTPPWRLGARTSDAEQIAGFELELDSLDDALDAATVHPMASHGTIEVRPIWSD